MRYVGASGRGMNTFGASPPLKELQRKFDFGPERGVAIAKELLGRGYVVGAINPEQSFTENARTAAAEVESTGRSSPLGATVIPGGVNFSVFSRGASAVELLLFDRVDDAPARVIPIDPATNHTYHYWHIFVLERFHGVCIR